MNDESSTDASHHEPKPAHPTDVMRQAFRDMEFNFEDEDDRLSLRLRLERVDVQVVCWGTTEDVAKIVINLPVRSMPDFRSQTGEFLHRLNFGSKRKFWEFDYNDGEIRLVSHMDTLMGPLTSLHFRSLLHCMIQTADIVFPYLTSILSGRMTPEFATDQAEAALNAQWNKDEKTDEEPPAES